MTTLVRYDRPSTSFSHHLPTRWRQNPLSDSRHKPNAFVFVATIKHIHAITCDRVMDSGVAVLCDESKEHLAPRIIKIMKDLIAKFL